MHSSFIRLFSSVLAAANLKHVQAATYALSTSYIGQDFLKGDFTFFTSPDPTNGRVTYVNQATAASQNLTFASNDVFVLRADHTTVLSASGPGRNSVRIVSDATFGSPSALVLDIAHMPEGCGTWPAFWTESDPWPTNGEIDILEGVNNQNNNQGTLHTGPSCTMPTSRAQTGTALNEDCYANDDGNEGCGVEFAANTFGPAFNSAGGGWFGMERTDNFIKIWFWPRGSSSVPANVAGGSSDVVTDNWGTPVAFFPNTDCDIASEFKPHNIIINLTFCGDWAGNVWAGSACAASTGAATCADYVNANPAAFANAYFEINAIRVYE